MCGVRKDLILVTGGNCTLPTIRIWQTTPLTARSHRMIHIYQCSAACAISTAQDYHPDVWWYSSSGISSASTPALCPNQSCPASALRFAVWSRSNSRITSNTASEAASRCANSITSGGERAGAIARAIVGSPTCPSICRTVTGSVMNQPGAPVRRTGYTRLKPVDAHQQLCPQISRRVSCRRCAKTLHTVFGWGALLPAPSFRPAFAATSARHGRLSDSTPK